MAKVRLTHAAERGVKQIHWKRKEGGQEALAARAGLTRPNLTEFLNAKRKRC